MAGRITKRVVDAAKPRDVAYLIWDAGDGAVKGFGIRVSPSGKKAFVAQFRVGGGRTGRVQRVTIGTFGVWTVDLARVEAERIIQAANRGENLRAKEKAAQAAQEAAAQAEADEARLKEELRFSALAERFLAEHVEPKRKANTAVRYRGLLDLYILPALGDRDARDIRRQDVAKLHMKMADKPVTANRAVATISAIYGWADRLEITPDGTRNPARKIDLFREQAHERFLSVAELQRLGEAIRTAETTGIAWEPNPDGKTKHAPRPENRLVRIEPSAAAALRLLLFTGARLREILHLEWEAVDLERGLLRLRDSKTGPKVIVLNAPARAVLASLPRNGRYVLPGEPKTLPDGTVVEQPRADLKRPWALVTRAAKLPGLRIHDLRHSFASVGAGDGHGLTIVGKLLGHSQTRTTERYAHLDNDPLRRASDAIANRIAAAMGEALVEPSAEVVPLRRETA